MPILLIRFAAGLVLLGGLLPTAVAGNIVRLAAIEREPYAGATLPDQGYVPEVARAAFARSGYQVQTNFYPPDRARHMAESGEVDGWMPVHADPALKAEYLLSAPLPLSLIHI